MYVSHLLVLSGASSEKLQAFAAEPLVPGTPRTPSFCHSTHLYGPLRGLRVFESRQEFSPALFTFPQLLLHTECTGDSGMR